MELQQRLLVTFVAELDERLRTLEQGLLALERAPRGEEREAILLELFRAAHSLKGAAWSVGIEPIERVCHWLEDVFAMVRDGRRQLDASLFELLLACVDAIRESGARLRRGEDAGGNVRALLPRLQTALAVPVEEPAPAMPASESPAPERTMRDGMVRLDAARLDALLAGSGELFVARRRLEVRRDEAGRLLERVRQTRLQLRAAGRHSGTSAGNMQLTKSPDPAAEQLRELDRQLDRFIAGFASDQAAIDRAAETLDAAIRTARMLPFSEACHGLERMVRDMSRIGRKQIRLAISGEDVELDRSVIEALKDPLMHLVRNAADHGIESADIRRAAGKSIAGTIQVSATLHGQGVMIAVEDDGRGLDYAAIRAAARLRDLPEGDDAQLSRYIFRPGFSTLRAPSEVSGRGIGLDAVRSSVEAVRGTVDVTSEPGRGTRFTMRLPLTVTTIRALLVGIGSDILAIDTSNVVGLARIAPADVRVVRGRETAIISNSPVPLISLARALGRVEPVPALARLPVVVAARGERRVGFIVDSLLGEQQILVRRLGPRLAGVRKVSGATILPTGRLALIVNASELIDSALAMTNGRPVTELATTRPASRRRILLAEDSLTTRALEKSILEGAGYEVIAAADGLEAWQVLLRQGADLVVSDIEMPRMDGFALTEAIRASEKFRDLPVILVTGRDAEPERARGLAAGANRYLVKSAFDQQTLLEAVASLV
ncbi:MAG: hybrid sensor histidine kinase/response regulator [Rhodospirillales bacterium]|nr:hybrid sensor histidine kinase/response regulator [Rhodospirillales bacterium]